jgi:hypothetical protein
MNAKRTMNVKRTRDKVTGAGNRAAKDLSARKSANVRGGRDAASGLPTGKRNYQPGV